MSFKKTCPPLSKSTPGTRQGALSIIAAVLDKRQPLGEVLKREGGKSGLLASLGQRDRAFVRKLVATTLRRLGQIDHILECCLKRPLSETNPRLRNTLRLGVTQIIYLKTPTHAAVDTAVRLAGKEKSSRGLVNAVLRRIIRETEVLRPSEDTTSLNVPAWLFDSWANAFGNNAAKAITRAHLEEPPLDLTLKDESETTTWQSRLDAKMLLPGSLRIIGGGRVEELPGYEEGAWWVQDAAATLPARLLLSALDKKSDKQVFDLCAAPGGKTLQLAASGASVTALDRSTKRLKLASDNLARLKLRAKTTVGDAVHWLPGKTPDGILLDAPCTATGTLRRNPDAAYLKSPSDVERFSGIQARLIEAAITMFKPGGILVFSTCSLQTEEGEQHAARLRADARLEHLPAQAEEMGIPSELINHYGDIRTFPFHFADRGGLDGFFATRFRRV